MDTPKITRTLRFNDKITRTIIIDLGKQHLESIAGKFIMAYAAAQSCFYAQNVRKLTI